MRKIFLTLLFLALTIPAFAVTEFICTINKTGEDYADLSDWEAAVQADLTSAATKVFSHGGITGTVGDGASVTGQTSGATATVVHATATQIMLKSISGTFQAEEVRVSAGNSVTTTNTGDSVIAVAECHKDDGTLADDVSVAGWTTSSTNYPKLTVHSADRHTGTAGTGFVLDPSSANTAISLSSRNTVVEWMEIKGWNGAPNYSGASAVSSFDPSYSSCSDIVRNNIIHDGVDHATYINTGIYLSYGTSQVYNNIIYNIPGYAVNMAEWQSNNFYNNTVYNYGTSNNSKAINLATNTYGNIKNNLIIAGTGTGDCFAYGATTHNNNNGSDTTGDVDSLTTAEFVSTSNLHLASTATSIDDGADLGTTPTGINIDIDGTTRSGTWDVGADEYVAAATARRIMLIQ